MITMRIIIAYKLLLNEWFLCMKKVAKVIKRSGNVPPLRFAKYISFEIYFTSKENKK